MVIVNRAQGEPLAILSHNEPVYYCVPAKTSQAMMDILEDIELGKLVQEREAEKEINVDIADL